METQISKPPCECYAITALRDTVAAMKLSMGLCESAAGNIEWNGNNNNEKKETTI